MYAVEILNEIKWVPFIENENISVIDKAVYNLTKLRPNRFIRVLKYGTMLEGCEILEILDGTEYQYWYFKNKHVRNKGVNFDHIGFYQKRLGRQRKK